MKKTLFSLFIGCCLAACTYGPNTPDQPIVILFDNDVHCAVDGYSKIAALKHETQQQTDYVTLVSSGDFAQGNTIGSLSQGKYIVDIMNAANYDIVTIGNHEFDYGTAQLDSLARRLNAEIVCCNISREGQMLYPAYTMRQYGKTQIAFIGAATPTTFNTSTPTYFQDAEGNIIYSFHKDDTYTLIEQAAKTARKQGADYVILLSHLGDDTDIDNSVNLIHATSGIDAVLDGHAHHVINRYEANAKGDSIILISTGTAFQNIGSLTISTNGHLTAELLPTDRLTLSDSLTTATITEVRDKLSSIVNQKIGYSEVPLSDRDPQGHRVVRNAETTLANFMTDAIRFVAGTDVAFANGGGLRAPLPQGNITYGSLYAIWPFNNTIRRMQATGQQIIDALEVGAKRYPLEDGDFMQVSGLRYTIDPNIPSSVVLDENGMFTSIGDTRRITKVEIQHGNEWQDLCPDSLYTVGGQSYIMVSKGAAGMFRFMTELPSDMVPDIDAIILYLNHLNGIIPASIYGNTEGRINIL